MYLGSIEKQMEWRCHQKQKQNLWLSQDLQKPKQNQWLSQDPQKPKQNQWLSQDPQKPKQNQWLSQDLQKPRQNQWLSQDLQKPKRYWELGCICPQLISPLGKQNHSRRLLSQYCCRCLACIFLGKWEVRLFCTCTRMWCYAYTVVERICHR